MRNIIDLFIMLFVRFTPITPFSILLNLIFLLQFANLIKSSHPTHLYADIIKNGQPLQARPTADRGISTSPQCIMALKTRMET